ncbi:MAG: family 16 glycoside hydrolase [Chloroflexales bacterium]
MRQAPQRARPGQSLVEIGLLLALIAAVAVVGLGVTGTSIRTVLCNVGRTFGGGGSCGTLFSDDFTNLKAWQIAAGTWASVDGVLTGGPSEGRIFTPLAANDYVIDVDTTHLAQGNGYGVFFRIQDFGKINGYSFQYDPGLGGFAFRKWVGGSEISAPLAFVKAPAGYDWYAANRKLQLTVSGDTFTALVDGQAVLTTKDSTYAAGGMGFRTWDSTKASFDNLTVRAVP